MEAIQTHAEIPSMGIHDPFHLISALHGRYVGEYQIHLQMETLSHRMGWKHFSLFLKDPQGKLSQQRLRDGHREDLPVLEGICSRGGRGVRGWIEIGDYYPCVLFPGEGLPPSQLDLSSSGSDHKILGYLSEAVPPGGHLMFAYEVSYESPFHRQTQDALKRGIPPACTPLGLLMFRAGFRLVKDWYLSEGGHEGPRKVWGEKPSDETESRRFDTRTFLQLLRFLCTRPDPKNVRLETGSRKGAVDILKEVHISPQLAHLKHEVIRVQEGRLRSEEMGVAALQTCDHVIESLRHKYPAEGYVLQGLAASAERCRGQPSYSPNPAP
jgi:hypothetical protein